MEKEKSLETISGEVVPVDKLINTSGKVVELMETILSTVKKGDIKDLETEKKFKIYKDSMGAVEIAQRMIRLEKGQTTSNIGIIVQAIKEAKKRRAVKTQDLEEQNEV